MFVFQKIWRVLLLLQDPILPTKWFYALIIFQPLVLENRSVEYMMMESFEINIVNVNENGLIWHAKMQIEEWRLEYGRGQCIFANNFQKTKCLEFSFVIFKKTNCTPEVCLPPIKHDGAFSENS